MNMGYMPVYSLFSPSMAWARFSAVDFEVAGSFQVVDGMNGLGFGHRSKQPRHSGKAFFLRFFRIGKISAIGLRLPCESLAQVFLCLGFHIATPPYSVRVFTDYPNVKPMPEK
jgi:hypothetical protein